MIGVGLSLIEGVVGWFRRRRGRRRGRRDRLDDDVTSPPPGGAAPSYLRLSGRREDGQWRQEVVEVRAEGGRCEEGTVWTGREGQGNHQLWWKDNTVYSLPEGGIINDDEGERLIPEVVEDVGEEGYSEGEEAMAVCVPQVVVGSRPGGEGEDAGRTERETKVPQQLESSITRGWGDQVSSTLPPPWVDPQNPGSWGKMRTPLPQDSTKTRVEVHHRQGRHQPEGAEEGACPWTQETEMMEVFEPRDIDMKPRADGSEVHPYRGTSRMKPVDEGPLIDIGEAGSDVKSCRHHMDDNNDKRDSSSSRDSGQCVWPWGKVSALDIWKAINLQVPVWGEEEEDVMDIWEGGGGGRRSRGGKGRRDITNTTTGGRTNARDMSEAVNLEVPLWGEEEEDLMDLWGGEGGGDGDMETLDVEMHHAGDVSMQTCTSGMEEDVPGTMEEVVDVGVGPEPPRCQEVIQDTVTEEGSMLLHTVHRLISALQHLTHIEKGNDMLEEAGLLTQTGEFDDVTGIKEITHELKTRVRSFTTRLDDLKDKISNTAQCYHLLDKSYEWALDAMKYVGSMKMETTATPAGLDKVTSSLDLYLREHPPINDNTFESMLELAQQLENSKLHEQCRQAQARCHETSNLLRTRQAALRRARGRLEKEERRRASLVSAMSHSGFGPDLQEPCWQPQTELACSVQSMMALRRRSYAGQSSAPMYSPQAQAFRDGVRDTNLSEYEEQFFREGLITEDMSDRIVTSLPGTSIHGGAASGAAGRTSMDSLRASKESLRGGSSENLSREQKSSSLPRELTGLGAATGGQQDQVDAGQSTGTAADQPLLVLPGRTGGNQPQKKLMRRMNSVLTGAEGEVLDHQPGTDSRKGKTLSLISGSSDSLPSMPEEEEGDEERQDGQVPNGERKFVWSPVPVNTHLARQGRGTLSSYHSMADLRLTDEEMKRRRTLELIMNEMVQTERNYVKSLGYVIDNYIPELLREDVPQPMRGKRNVIFGNLEQIHTFHSQYFLAALEQCEVTPFQICHCFLQHAQEFYLYALYNKNKPKSDDLMSEYAAKFFRRKQGELNDRMDLSSYLLKPVQRMGKYALLLKQILKECPESEQEHADLKSALEMVKFQLRHGNDLLVMDSLRDCDVNLQEQGRLLRQDQFLVWTGRRKSLRQVFLFEELILFSKTRRSTNGHDVYIYKNSMKTADIGLTENVGESQYKFEIWFRRRTDGATRTLQAPNMDVKAAWVREISRLLWKQAIKNRELRLQEMARMGIGSKPCLDLKQSKDNIKDRFVNLTTNRVPRSRNSIAVSSFEHLKNGTKRPHSIISVSSTSSSNSSHSSGPGLFSSILPGSNLETTSESPQRNSKSYTICSNESGIVADMGGTTPPTSTSLMTDSCTQTTLKRPPRHPKAPSSSSASDTVSLTAGGNTGTQTSSHMLSTDV